MSRLWKPGDVATFETADGDRATAIRTCEGKWTAYAPGRDRSWIDRPWKDGQHGLRPVVVIDPDGDIQRLADALRHFVDGYISNDATRAALRSLIANPKPEEPTTRGAVVVDAKGLEWVRVHPGGQAWVNGYGRWAAWGEIEAVEVKRP